MIQKAPSAGSCSKSFVTARRPDEIDHHRLSVSQVYDTTAAMG
jgi:hypothetical protein